MAEVLAVIPGLRLADVDAMALTELMDWHAQALRIARALHGPRE